MEFEYTSAIYVEDCDIDEMVRLVKKGWSTYAAFTEVLRSYDDVDYYNRDCIYTQVEEEIEKRM